MLGIGWQRRLERRWVANRLANEQAIRPLLKYLMTTEVGGREGRAERAAEWDQRVDQEGEELRIRDRFRRASSPKAESR